MGEHVLVVGGAGFVGSHVVAELLGHGYRVRVLDNLQTALPAKERCRAGYARDTELLVGDVRDDLDVRRALQGVDAVVHAVSDATPAGEPSHAGLCTLLAALRDRPVAKLVITSSLAVYDEGLYRRPNGALTGVEERSSAQLAGGRWEPWARAGETLLPWPTPEGFTPRDPSGRARFYRVREHMALEFGRAQGTAVCVLRPAHVYGRGRSPSHPRASALCSFGARLLDGSAPLLFEDGLQRRDFVSAYDVARAFRLALERGCGSGGGQVINVGTGRAYPVRDLARRLAVVLGKQHIAAELTGSHRLGDVRHAVPDVTRARAVLGFAARVGLEEGLIELAAWLEEHCAEARAPKPNAAAAAPRGELRA